MLPTLLARFTRRPAVPSIAGGLACLALLSWIATRPAGLYDADAYFHLAVARLYGEQGLVASLPWARFSIMHEAYGDKELLFHLLLLPATWLSDLVRGGQLTLAAIDTALAVSLWHVAARALGGRGALLVPALVLGTSATFALRACRLRPELLSLLFLLWVLHFLAQRRYALAALTTCLLGLSHTAVHSVLILGVLFTLYGYLADRELEPRLLGSLVLGVAAAFVLHPHFPSNLRIAWVQNVTWFVERGSLDVGSELGPFTTASVAQLDAAFVAGLALLWLARAPAAGASPNDDTLRRGARFFALGALAFGVLFLHLGRMALYCVPLSALALAYALAVRGERIGSRVALPGGRTLATLPVLAVVCAAGAANVLGTLYVNFMSNGAWTGTRAAELVELARALPPSAKVAAHWSNAEDYVFHAPHARYLNVLDPIFMHVAHPSQRALLDDILLGHEPDVPERLAVDLDSDYIAFAGRGRERLLARLSADPRMERLYSRSEHLFRVRRDRSALFVTAWRVTGGRAGPATRYPVDRSPRGAGLGGYVDATRVGGARGCVTFETSLAEGTPYERALELAPWGPGSLSIDGSVIARLAAPAHAELGGGAVLSVRLPPGPHSVRVHTCPDAGRSGFYLVDRGPLR